MNAVPKGSMPHIFSWISLYKEQSKPLPASSVLKSFHNDPALFRLYSEYLREQLKHKTIYKEQLVFYFISILTSVLPLIDELVYSLTISISSDPFAWNNLRRQTLVVLGQLWNFYNEDDVSEEAEVFANLSSEVLLKNEELLLTLIEESYNISKFVFFFVIDKLNHNDDKAIRLLQFIDVPKNDLFFSVVVKKLLLYITEKCVTDEGRAGAVSTFEQLLKSNKSKVVNELRKQSKSISTWR
ncbi:snoRNA-binding rRNA-processing protein utp10 [Candidozyma auris]